MVYYYVCISLSEHLTDDEKEEIFRSYIDDISHPLYITQEQGQNQSHLHWNIISPAYLKKAAFNKCLSTYMHNRFQDDYAGWFIFDEDGEHPISYGKIYSHMCKNAFKQEAVHNLKKMIEYCTKEENHIVIMDTLKIDSLLQKKSSIRITLTDALIEHYNQPGNHHNGVRWDDANSIHISIKKFLVGFNKHLLFAYCIHQNKDGIHEFMQELYSPSKQ